MSFEELAGFLASRGEKLMPSPSRDAIGSWLMGNPARTMRTGGKTTTPRPRLRNPFSRAPSFGRLPHFLRELASPAAHLPSSVGKPRQVPPRIASFPEKLASSARSLASFLPQIASFPGKLASSAPHLASFLPRIDSFPAFLDSFCEKMSRSARGLCTTSGCIRGSYADVR